MLMGENSFHLGKKVATMERAILLLLRAFLSLESALPGLKPGIPDKFEPERKCWPFGTGMIHDRSK